MAFLHRNLLLPKRHCSRLPPPLLSAVLRDVFVPHSRVSGWGLVEDVAFAFVLGIDIGRVPNF